MTLNLVNISDFHALIDEELAEADPVLTPWKPNARRFLRRHLLDCSHAIRVHPSGSDPEWMHERVAEGKVLHRLEKRHLRQARVNVGQMVDNLAEVAAVADDPDHPLGRQAASLLRSLPHAGRPKVGRVAPVVAQVRAFPERARNALLRTNRHKPICRPETIKAGGLTGTRCTTIREVLSLGSEARNCLASPMKRHLGIQTGEEEIWALRSANDLVAVLAIKNDPRRLVELKGPDNVASVSGHGADLADWCRAIGVLVSRRCEIRLTDILPAQIALPEEFEDEESPGMDNWFDLD
ncbi:hypothetical protein [Paracoccus yeei]|nr:hypothetical protein [Paracoccus yeei]